MPLMHHVMIGLSMILLFRGVHVLLNLCVQMFSGLFIEIFEVAVKILEACDLYLVIACSVFFGPGINGKVCDRHTHLIPVSALSGLMLFKSALLLPDLGFVIVFGGFRHFIFKVLQLPVFSFRQFFSGGENLFAVNAPAVHNVVESSDISLKGLLHLILVSL